jgi:hypothetical protein
MNTNKKKGNQRRDSITDPSIAKLFEGKNFAFLATLMKDGSPQVTPTWVDIEEQQYNLGKHCKRSNQI